MISFASSNNKNIFRLYEVNTGACLGDAYVSRKNNDSFSYLMQNPTDGHHLALITRHGNNGEASVTDLATGKKIHTFKVPSQHFFKAIVTSGGEYLLFLFMDRNAQRFLEVYRNRTWESLGHFPSAEGLIKQIAFIDDTHWVTLSATNVTNQNVIRERLEFFHFDPNAKSLTRVSDHPLHLKEFSNHDHGVIQGNYFYTNSTGVPLSLHFPFLAKVEAWLDRQGIKWKRQQSKVQVQVYDIRTGERIKQLSHLPEGYYQLSPQARYLSYALKSKDDKNQDQIALSVYALPHHLWQPTLSWMQWLSWLLILPWPLRYFIARRANSLVPNAVV